jgi:hypothetical protein
MGELLVGHVHVSTRLLEAFSVPTSRGGPRRGNEVTGDAVTLLHWRRPLVPEAIPPVELVGFQFRRKG